MPSRVEAGAAGLIALAAAVYVVAAWTVRPGFYDCCAAPQYDYVSPPPLLAGGNIQPTSGEARFAIGPGGVVAGGLAATRDQPQAQAKVFIAPDTLSAPPGAGQVEVDITPYAPPSHVAGVVLEGNVYCVTSNSSFRSGQQAQIALSVPPYGPFATTVYYAPSRTVPTWPSIGGTFDLNNYQTTAAMRAFGCFAVGYPANTGQASQPRLGGPLLPVVTAIAIALVLLAGLPLGLRRRLRR